MAGRGDIEAGRAYVTTYVKNDPLFKGLNAASARLKGLGTSIMGIGGALTGLGAGIVAPLIGAVAQFSAMGSELADMSARTGMAVGSLAELKFAAEQTGAGIEDIEKAIKKQQQQGITGTFDEIAAKIAAIEDPAKRTQAAIEAWGKAGPKLLPMVDNLQKLRQEARDLGLVPTEEAVNMADAIGDAWDAVHSVMKATVFQVGAALAPVLLPALETVKGIAAWFNRWAKENGAIIRSVFMIGLGITAVGAAVTVIGAAIFGLGAMFGAAASAIAMIASVIATLTSPVALIIGAIAAGAFAWVRFTSSGQQAVAMLKGFFLPMVETIKTTIGGIGDALKAGDLQLAAQIAVSGLKVIFLQAIDQISNAIGGSLGDALGDIGARVIQGDLKGAWDTTVLAMGKIWADFAAGVVGMMAGVANAVVDTWRNAVKAIAGFFLDMSAKGGFMGKVASSVLGVDMSQEQAVAEKNRLAQIDVKKRLLAQAMKDAETADAQGSHRGLTGDNYRKFADDLKKQITELEGATTNVAAEAKGVAGEQVDAMGQTAKDFMKSLADSSHDAAEDAGRNLGERTEKGPRVNEALDAERANLEKLRQEAQEAAEQAKQKKADGGDMGPVAAEIKSAASVTGFSGFALGLAGQGGGVQDLARTAAQQLKEAKETKTYIKRMADKDGPELE